VPSRSSNADSARHGPWLSETQGIGADEHEFQPFAVRGAIRVSEHLLTARNAELSRANGQPGALCSPPAPSSVASQQSLDVARIAGQVQRTVQRHAKPRAYLSENGGVSVSHC
jgi:hypothetical protein